MRSPFDSASITVVLGIALTGILYLAARLLIGG